MRKRMMGNQYTKGMVPINARKVINVDTNEIFDSISIAANKYGYKKRALTAWLTGQNKNKTLLKIYYGKA